MILFYSFIGWKGFFFSFFLHNYRWMSLFPFLACFHTLRMLRAQRMSDSDLCSAFLTREDTP